MPDHQSTNKNSLRIPAEWEEHCATWLAWPNDDDYFGNRIKNVEKIYLKIIQFLHRDELIKLIVLNGKEEERVKILLGDLKVDLSKIIFYQIEYVDVWIRDYGPTFIKDNNKISWIKWQYDYYGGKFPELSKDNNVFLNLKEKIDFKMHEVEVAMEGGAIEANGLGTLLTTEECLLENRNHGKSKKENDSLLLKLTGAINIIWLNKGLVNDHTNGHIDEIARFVGPAKILCVYENNTADENYERLSENYKILENSLDQDGNKFEIIKLPMPHIHYQKSKKHNNEKAPVSYANFYIGNKTVLVPSFNDENDQRAISVIKSCFPDREIVSIDCQDLIYGGGALHCITQQEPKL